MIQGRGEMQQVYPVEGESYRYWSQEQDGSFIFTLAGDATDGSESSITINIDSRQAGEGICRGEDGRAFPFAWAWLGPSTTSGELHLWLAGDLHIFRRADPSSGSGSRRGGAAGDESSGDILAPMPGAVLEVLVSEGDQVERNQTVVVMESMKMELLITAPRDGVVSRVSVQAGQQVERGMRLLELSSEK